MTRAGAAAATLAAACIIACGGGRAAGSGPSIRLRLAALDGGEIDLARYRGRVTVLHLFDTATAAAQLDAEQLDELARARPARATVIGICLDPEGYPMAVAWRRAVRVRYLVALADRALRDGQTPVGRVRVIPTTIVLDGVGRVAFRIERPLAAGELARLVSSLEG